MRTKSGLFFLFLFLISSIQGQSLSIGVGAGMSIVQGKNYFTGDLGYPGGRFVNGADLSPFMGLAFKNEYNFGFNVNYTLKNLPISLITQIHYIPLRGKQSSLYYDAFLNHEFPSEVTTMIDLWSLAIGGRYFMEFNQLKPFLNASFLINYLGDTRFQNEYTNIKKVAIVWSDYENGVRYGYNIGAGIDYSLTSMTSVELEAGYSFYNVLNRRGANPIDELHPSVEERLNNLNIMLNIYYTVF